MLYPAELRALIVLPSHSSLATSHCYLVGVERFELPTSCSQSRRATRLRYTPDSLYTEYRPSLYPSISFRPETSQCFTLAGVERLLRAPCPPPFGPHYVRSKSLPAILSNSRHPAPKAGALPDCAIPRMFVRDAPTPIRTPKISPDNCPLPRQELLAHGHWILVPEHKRRDDTRCTSGGQELALRNCLNNAYRLQLAPFILWQ
jgi:hypothetical protein